MTPAKRTITESSLSGFVKDTATAGGWIKTHFRPARTADGWRTPLEGDKGFPDWVLAHYKLRRIVFAELKGDGGNLSPEQELWIGTLQRVPGVECYVWWPSDMPEIRRVLLGHLGLHGG